MLTIAPTESDVFSSVRAFLLKVLPNGRDVFTGSITGATMNVSKVINAGAGLAVGDAVLGLNVEANTVVTAIGTVVDGVGDYTVTPSQTVDPATMSNGVEVIQSQVNRVPEPVAEDFVTMTMTADSRLGTNLDTSEDVVFTAAIAGTVMTVSGIAFGAIKVGADVWGATVAPNTTIRAQLTSNTFAVSPSQTAASQKMAAGGKAIMQPSQMSIQLDIHGPSSANHALTISTVFRDAYAVEEFVKINPLISPLFTTDPRQMPFVNAEQQYEDRWVVALELQINQTVRVPQQFADVVTVTVTSVETIPLS